MVKVYDLVEPSDNLPRDTYRPRKRVQLGNLGVLGYQALRRQSLDNFLG